MIEIPTTNIPGEANQQFQKCEQKIFPYSSGGNFDTLLTYIGKCLDLFNPSQIVYTHPLFQNSAN